MAGLASINIRFRAYLAKFSTDMQNANKQIAKMGKEMSKVGKSLSIRLTAPIVAVGGAALNTFSQLEGVQSAFEKLNNQNLLADLQKATKNTVSNLELMKAAVQADNFKIPLEQLSTLFEFARRRAKATGQSVDLLVDSIVTGIGRKSSQVIDNLGISAVQLKENLNGATAAASSIADVAKAVSNIAKKELEKMGTEALTSKESFLQLKTEIVNLGGEFGKIIAEGVGPLVDVLKDIVGRFKELSPETKKFIVILSGIAAAIGPLLVLAGTVLPAISAGFVALTGPVGLAIAAMAAVAVVIAKNWEPIKKVLVSIANYFVDLYNESTALRIAIQGIFLPFKNLYAVVKNVLKNIYTIIVSFARQIGIIFRSFGDVLKGALTKNPALIKKGYADLFRSTKTNFSNFTTGIKQNFVDTFSEIAGNIKTAIDSSLKRSKYELPVTLKVKKTEGDASANQEGQPSMAAAANQEGQPSMATAANQDTIVLKPEIAWDQAFQDQEELDKVLDEQMQWEDFFDNEAIAKENERMAEQFNQTTQKMQAFKQKAQTIGTGVSDVFSSIGNSIVDSFGLASHGLQGFIKELLKTTIELIRMQMANSMANAIFSGTSSAAATGPAALFTTPAFIAKGLAGVAAAFATLPKFAEGGFVGGNSFSGDKILARLNSGELVLNQKQQKSLLSMISGNSSKLNLTVDVNGMISGTDLKLVLDRTTVKEERLE